MEHGVSPSWPQPLPLVKARGMPNAPSPLPILRLRSRQGSLWIPDCDCGKGTGGGKGFSSTVGMPPLLSFSRHGYQVGWLSQRGNPSPTRFVPDETTNGRNLDSYRLTGSPIKSGTSVGNDRRRKTGMTNWGYFHTSNQKNHWVRKKTERGMLAWDTPSPILCSPMFNNSC